MEACLIVALILLAVASYALAWYAISEPIAAYNRHELVIAEFAREISRWDHEQGKA